MFVIARWISSSTDWSGCGGTTALGVERVVAMACATRSGMMSGV